ncbi:ElyC/SanA/YdcF family protein [Psychromonas sp. MME2]|uniref:ElyC/SanA/YdcF family protein n=1 Tax=unclassified Psychromonas TaxID=2614957 RepID=UPI00339BD35C
MLFILKKWIGGLLMPLPLLLFVFLIGLILLLFTQKQKLAKLFLSLTFVLLCAFSSLPISDAIVQPLERQHPPLKNIKQDYAYILLLGSGGTADPDLPVTGQLSATALSRFMEALRIYHANPNAKLVVSGSGFGDLKSHAQLLEELALAMKVPAQQIIRLDDSKDTDHEARLMSDMIRGKKAVLVTSATHIDRALRLFFKYGTAPDVAPSNYLSPKRATERPSYYYIPNAYYLYATQVTWHEYLGQLQNKLQ